MAGLTRNLCLAATVACLTGGLFGYSVGFIGGLIVLPSFLSHFHLNGVPPHELANIRSGIVTIWLVGAFFGSPLAMPVCSRLGRRPGLQLSAVIYVLGAAIQLFSDGNLAFFDAGRALNGVGVGVGMLASPMYLSEICQPSERGMLMSGYQTALQLCALVGFWGAYVSQATIVAASPLQWQLPVAVQSLPGAILVLGTFVIPETPRFLAIMGQRSAMEESLSWLRHLHRRDPELLQELNDIYTAADEYEKLQNRSFFQELMKKDIRKRLGIGIGLMVLQNMVGLNALNYYAASVFMSAGFTSISSSLFLTGVFGLVKLISSIFFMLIAIRIKGNLFWLKLGSAICGISMIVLAYCVRLLPDPGQIIESGITLNGIISVLMVYVFAFCFGISLGPIGWNICGEIFPLHINAQCVMITTCSQWLFYIIIAAITPVLITNVGWITYLIYAGFCVLSYVWISAVVPETRGIPLGRPMDDLFGGLSEGGDDDDFLEVSEVTALIVGDRRRRSSLAAYT